MPNPSVFVIIHTMDKKTRYYVSRKNALTWMVALCMVCSAVARVLFVGGKGTDVWSQIILPMAAVLLYGLICLLFGKEQFYKMYMTSSGTKWPCCIPWAWRCRKR